MLAAGSNWFFELFPPGSVGLTVFIVAAVAALGLAAGSFRFRGVALGIPGVMFAGLIVGRILQLENLNASVVAFVRDFGLILFVYAIGVQVGPGFIASLRRQGLPLNLLALAIVLLGAGLAILVARQTGTDMRAAIGLFTGATTNAPALGSAEESLKSMHGTVVGAKEMGELTGPAFAIAYPFGLLGVILAMILIRAIFRVHPQAEAEALKAAERAEAADLARLNIELVNPNVEGLAVKDIPALEKTNVVISRIHSKGMVRIPTPETVVHVGDVVLAVGLPAEVRDLQIILGKPAELDLLAVPSNITTRQILVTRRAALGKTVEELNLSRKFGVAATRVSRAGLEFTAVGALRLQFGDRIRAVGEAAAIDAAAKLLGDSSRELNTPRLLPMFVGIMLGVLLGSLQLKMPGLPAAVKLGLASGPLIVAIVLARVGRMGPLIWYMPQSASGLLRELGIVMFLIGVGLNGGEGFFAKIATREGLYWVAYGAAITLAPLLLVGAFARLALKTNYLHLCGLLCGSLNSPSLAFTQTMTTSEAPAVAFATVYPLTMISRVLVAQVLVLAFAR